MRAWAQFLSFLLLLSAASEGAWAHGGRGVRYGATGVENGPRLGRVTDAELVPATPAPPPTGEGEAASAPDQEHEPHGSKRLTNNVRAADYDWRQWWAVNRWSVLPDRADLRKRRARWEIEAGRSAPVLLERNRHLREARGAAAEALVIPALLRALEAKRDEGAAVRAAALLALGKCARSAGQADVLWAHARDGSEPPLVRRSAALAIGLLRRTRAEDRFRTGILDLMRRRLFELFDDEGAHRTTRAFAMYAIALLGDQPFGKATLGGRVIARELWARLDRNYRAHDLPVALLTALGRQPPSAMPTKRPLDLKRIVEGTWVQRRRWNHYERGHAMTAQAALRAPEWNRLIWYINSTQRKYPTFIRMSTFNALFAGAANIPDEYRKSMAVSLIVSMRAARNTLTRGLAHISMARVLNEDLRRGSESILEKTRAFRWLIDEASNRGEYYSIKGSFATLGVGLAAQGLGHDVPKGEAVRLSAARKLRTLLNTDKHGLYVASCAAALGCTEHEHAAETLVTLLKGRPRRWHVLARYFAPAALGQIGWRKPIILDTLRREFSRSSTTAEMRSQVLLGMVMLGDPKARGLLLSELALTTSTWAAAQTVLALGLLDDLTTLAPTRALAEDRKRHEGVRAYAYAALGVLADPEARGSILKLLIGSNYPLRTRASTALQGTL